MTADRMENKEENPLLANGLAFFSEKQGGKSSAPAKAVAFFSEKQGGKSSAPAKAVAFSFGKQGGLV